MLNTNNISCLAVSIGKISKTAGDSNPEPLPQLTSVLTTTPLWQVIMIVNEK